MKWVIWNKTQDNFWNQTSNDWSNRYYATKYTISELEAYLNTKWFGGEPGDLILAVIAVSV